MLSSTKGRSKRDFHNRWHDTANKNAVHAYWLPLTGENYYNIFRRMNGSHAGLVESSAQYLLTISFEIEIRAHRRCARPILRHHDVRPFPRRYLDNGLATVDAVAGSVPMKRLLDRLHHLHRHAGGTNRDHDEHKTSRVM